MFIIKENFLHGGEEWSVFEPYGFFNPFVSKERNFRWRILVVSLSFLKQRNICSLCYRCQHLSKFDGRKALAVKTEIADSLNECEL